MYAPLQFLEEGTNTLRVPNVSQKKEKMLQGFLYTLLDKSVTATRQQIVSIFASDIVKQWELMTKKVYGYTGLDLDPEDLRQLSMRRIIHNEWGKYKLTYKLSKEMLDRFLDTPDKQLFPCEIYKDIPTMYIDLSDCGNILHGANGIFVISDMFEGAQYITAITLYQNARVPWCYTNNKIEMTGNSGKVLIDTTDTPTHPVNLEDGRSFDLEVKLISKIISNTLAARHATNCEVRETERTKTVYRERSASAKPVNKIREVYECEIVMKSKRPKSKVAYNYVGDVTPGRSLKSHYRNPHWSHYWIGSGDNKELILKWIEGVWVTGSGANNVNVKEL